MNKILLDIPRKIETPRLILKVPTAADGEDLHGAIMDGYEDYIKWLGWPKDKPSVQAVEEDCRKAEAEFIMRENIRFLILDKASGKVMGRCALPSQYLDWPIPQCAVAYFIRASERKKGFVTEAINALTRIAFEFLKMRKVEIYCDTQNTASSSIPKNLNYALEYTKKGGWLRENGDLSELEVYSIFSLENLPKIDVKWL